MEFKKGSVPVDIVARVYGKDPAWVRAGIITGYLPIGIATKDRKIIHSLADIGSGKGRTNFYISPKRLCEETGYYWEGNDVD